MPEGTAVIGSFQHTEAPASWALAELDAALADMEPLELIVTFAKAATAYAQALRSGTVPELADVFAAVVRDTAPQ